MRRAVLVAISIAIAGCGGLENVGGLGGNDPFLDAQTSDAAIDLSREIVDTEKTPSIDTSLPDTSLVDDAAVETSAIDTSVVDTTGPDTNVPDTFVLDARDANVADTRDSSVVDTATKPDADAAPPAPFCDATNLDLVACYRFEIDDTTAQPFDQSSYGNHGTTTLVTYGPGVAGKAIVLTPTSRVMVPDDSSFDVTGQLTIEMWIRAAALPTAAARAGLFDNDGRYGFFVQSGGVIRATSPMLLDTPSGSVVVGSWQHVAYTYDGKKQIIYVNGTAVASRDLVGSMFSGGSGDGITIGGNAGTGTPDSFEGSIDQLRVFRVGRTPTQICQAAGKC